MKSIMTKIDGNAKDIIDDNNFLFVAFENRLILRLTHIFEKYKIPLNKNIVKKNLEENLINNLSDYNVEIIEKYVRLLKKYENIVIDYVNKKTDTKIIKKATMSFVEKISSKNSSNIPSNISNNFIDYIKSIIFVYDNYHLNNEVLDRIKNDVNEIIIEFNRNNYNFVIESINVIIKNIINNI